MSLKWPASEAEMKAAGYRLTGRSRCTGRMCQTWIYWYKTPQGKSMPMSKVINEPGEVFEPHFIVCISAKEFRK